MVKKTHVISNRATKVISLDCMAFVNSLPKDKDSQVKTSKDLPDLFMFMRPLIPRCAGYNEVRLVFDQYIANSPKVSH